MSCLEPEREEEFFYMTRYTEGLIPTYNFNYSIPTLKQEIEKKLLKLKNALGGDEERKLEQIISINSRVNFSSSEKAKSYRFLMDNYIFPFLKRLVVYRVNEPEGLKELSLLIDVIEKELSLCSKTPENIEDRIERTFDILISHLYQLL
ncbi:MAG: hypothetical protein DSY35_05310 [Desulfurobacterium sp.]|nr:MAG: hypothetical protein DSY35_05310 [Desulfurobacterium sp.]